MTIALHLSDQRHSVHPRVSEIGLTLYALLKTFGDYDKEIAQTFDVDRIASLKLEQEKTGEIFQKLMNTIGAAKEGRDL